MEGYNSFRVDVAPAVNRRQTSDGGCVIIGEKTRRFAVNSMFPSFFHALLGLVLAQVGAAQMHGAWGLRVFLGVPGVVLSELVLFRARLHWQVISAGMSSLRPRDLRWYVLLLGAGASVGILVSAGSVMLVGMAAAFTYLLPWTKIPVCRDRFAVSSLVMLAGAIAWVVIGGGPAQSLYFVIAAWILYVPPMCMHLLVLVSFDRGTTRLPCIYDPGDDTESPIIQNQGRNHERASKHQSAQASL